MAFVSVPRDLSRIKCRLVFNMSARQLICFGTAVVIGVPTYIFTRSAIGNNTAALLMIGLMLPFFFFAMYEKHGQPAEILLRNYIRSHIYWPGVRPYKTENFYENIEKEGNNIVIESRNKNTATTAYAKASVRKHTSVKSKPR